MRCYEALGSRERGNVTLKHLVFTIALIHPVPTLASCSDSPTPFRDLYRLSQVQNLAKGQYETTPQWRDRLAKIFPLDQMIVARAKISDASVEYNADAQSLSIRPYTIRRGMMNSSVSDDYDTLAIGERHWPGQSYVGQNALGVSKNITVSFSDEFEIAWHRPENAFMLESFAPQKLAIAPAEAKDLQGHLTFQIEGKPAAPYVVENRTVGRPTIDDPFERFNYFRGLVIHPSCLAVIDDRSGKVFMEIDPITLRRRAK